MHYRGGVSVGRQHVQNLAADRVCGSGLLIQSAAMVARQARRIAGHADVCGVVNRTQNEVDSLQNSRRSMRRRLAAVTTLAATLYVAVCFYFWFTQDQKIFMPLREVASDPGRLGLAYEQVQIAVGTGDEAAQLNGYWVQHPDAAAPVMLYLHGQDANIGKNLVHTLNLHQCGYSVLVIDYRGFGDSLASFTPSEQSVYEDADAAWAFLTEELGVATERTFIFGHSLGGAIAIELATRHSDAAGLIVESSFTTISEIAQWKIPITSLLPLDLLLNHHFRSVDKIGEVAMPKLFIHGRQDPKVPFRMSQQLHAAAREPKAPLLCIEGGGHADCCLIGLVEHRAAIQDFVSKTLER